MAEVDQMPDQRMTRLQIEHVVLHDPGRHDEDRLAQHLTGRRRVPDELHQPVAVHDAARRRGDVDADLDGIELRGRRIRPRTASSTA